jgi:hypothetical protein
MQTYRHDSTGMYPDKNGKWVKVEDVSHAMKELKETIEAIEKEGL